MKKTLAIICAVAMALSMFASFAYVIGPGIGNKVPQLSMIDIRAVDFSNTKVGLNVVGSLDKSSKLYQVGDEIEVAVIFEIINAAKDNSVYALVDIPGFPFWGFDVYVTSDTVDFSYARHNVVRLVSNLYAYGQNLGNVVLPEITPIFGGAGTPLGAVEDMLWASAYGGGTVAYNGGNNTVMFYVLGGPAAAQIQDAFMYFDAVDDEVPVYVIPSLNIGDTTFSVGPATVTFTAPKSILYGVVFFGRCKEPLKPENKGELKVRTLIDPGQFWYNNGFFVANSGGNHVTPVRQLDLDKYTIMKVTVPSLLFVPGDWAAAQFWAGMSNATMATRLDYEGLFMGDVSGKVPITVADVAANALMLGVSENFCLPFVLPTAYDIAIPTGSGRVNCMAGGSAFMQANGTAAVGGITDTAFGAAKVPYSGTYNTIQGISAWSTVGNAYGPNATASSYNGIALYIIIDNEDWFPLVTLATEYGAGYAQSVAAFDAWGNRIMENRVQGFTYADDGTASANVHDKAGPVGPVSGVAYPAPIAGGAVLRASKIINAMRFFEFDTGFAYNYKITDGDFDKFARGAEFSDWLVNDYDYGSASLILPEEIVDEGNEDFDDEDFDDEELPETGDFSIAIATMATAIIAAAALAFVLKKAR